MTAHAPSLVQWALWGKEDNRPADHVMRCSDGPIRSDDFRDLINRYHLGLVGNLPQVAVNWIPGRDKATHVAVAFHEQELAGRRACVKGRRAIHVRYFAARYEDLAAAGTSYRDYALAVSRYLLPPGGQAPIAAEIVPVPSRQADGPDPGFAMRVAASLLDGQPVCITGADQLSVSERLGFIDAVASLLPYGMRSRMSAATMASATAQDLSFRLFFASAPARWPTGCRPAEWGRPGTARPLGSVSGWYLSWLHENAPGAQRTLAGMTAPAGFSAREIARMPDLLRHARLPARNAPGYRRQYDAAKLEFPGATPPGPEPAPRAVPARRAGGGASWLSTARTGNLPGSHRRGA